MLDELPTRATKPGTEPAERHGTSPGSARSTLEICLMTPEPSPLSTFPAYHLASLGEHAHPASQTTQVLDAEAVSAMITSFQAAAKEVHFAGVLVDFDHFSHHPARPTEAAGWIVDLEQRADGLWARIRWTDLGLAAVQGGRYRFLSPVWLASDCEALGSGRLRPRRLHRAALTNDPNLRGLTPLTNRQTDGLPSSLLFGTGQPVTLAVGTAEVARCAGSVPKTTMNDASLIQLLELPPGAAESDVLTAVRELKNRCTEACAAQQQLLEAQVENDLHQHQASFQPEARPQWKDALLQNRNAALALLRSVRVSPEPVSASGVAARPMHNRQNAITRGPISSGLAASEDDLTDRRKAAVVAYQNRSACGFEQAWDAVKTLQPELFPVRSSTL
jgi:hypothetical protein